MSELKPFLFGQWNYPSELPTHNENEVVDCVVIIQGVQTGIIRLEETEYRYGEWDISNAWNLIAWNHRAQPANEPLTLEELRGMDGEPVWVKEITPEPIDGDYWGLVDPDFVCVGGYGVGAVLSTATDGKFRFAQTPISDYGKTWLAYRRKPEKSEDDAKV